MTGSVMSGETHDERFPILEDLDRQRIGTELATIALQSSQLAEDFSAVERIPRYADGRRENDVEHSFMLAIAAPEIAYKLDLKLNIDTVRRFAIVHDLLEIEVGDVATFDLTPAQFAEKERLAAEAKERLLAKLPPLLARDLELYERQDTPEAVFVRMVDKLLPVAVDITGDGVRIISEDYGVANYEQLQNSHNALHSNIARKFGNDFPDLVAAHAVLCKLFEDKYLETIASRKMDEKPRNPTEIELKYLVDLAKLPKDIDLATVKKVHLRQGYVAIGADRSETRVRSFDDERYELTVKSPGMIARDEQTATISQDMFDGLWLQTEGRRVAKTRYYIPLKDFGVELDVYEDQLEGLVTAEVEFDGRPAEAMLRATTFEPPEWFGKNVSEDGRYKNRSLSAQLPHDVIQLGTKQF